MLERGILIKTKSDEELISLANLLQEGVGEETFIFSDLILRAAVIGELEERGFIVKEVLKIEHSGQAKSRENNQGEGGDEKKEGNRGSDMSDI